jgi:poly(3-hydroxybutyrate) depolymerase
MRCLTALFLNALFLTAAPAFAQPFDICADPGTAALPAGYQITQRKLDLSHGPRWYCEVLPPGYSASASDYPFVIVFHGGSQGPQDMLDGNRGLLKEILDRGYVAAFPAGLPLTDGTCDYAALPCENSNWNDDVNFEFINALLEHGATFNLDEERIFLIGFPGGAGLIFRAIANDDFALPVTAFATAAGSLDGMKVTETALGLPLRNVTLGTPLHAVLYQATNDPVVAYAGGLNLQGDTIHHSYAVRIDLFRALTGNLADPGSPVSGLPAPARGSKHVGGTHQVVALTGEDGHVWPRWLSPVVFDLFDRYAP